MARQEAPKGFELCWKFAISAEASADQRAQAVVDAANLAEHAGRLKVEIRQLSADSVRYQTELDAYRAAHPPIT